MPKKPPSDRALIRLQAVSAYLAIDPPRGQRHALRQQLAAKTWPLPDDQAVTFAAETLRGWVRAYQQHSFDGLEDTTRADLGALRQRPREAGGRHRLEGRGDENLRVRALFNNGATHMSGPHLPLRQLVLEVQVDDLWATARARKTAPD